jgi:hypothetical protein
MSTSRATWPRASRWSDPQRMEPLTRAARGGRPFCFALVDLDYPLERVRPASARRSSRMILAGPSRRAPFRPGPCLRCPPWPACPCVLQGRPGQAGLLGQAMVRRPSPHESSWGFVGAHGCAPLIWNDLSSPSQCLMSSCTQSNDQHLWRSCRKDGECDGRTGHNRRLINLIFAGLVPGSPEHRMTIIRRELPLSTFACSGLSPNAQGRSRVLRSAAVPAHLASHLSCLHACSLCKKPMLQAVVGRPLEQLPKGSPTSL